MMIHLLSLARSRLIANSPITNAHKIDIVIMASPPSPAEQSSRARGRFDLAHAHDALPKAEGSGRAQP